MPAYKYIGVIVHPSYNSDIRSGEIFSSIRHARGALYQRLTYGHDDVLMPKWDKDGHLDRNQEWESVHVQFPIITKDTSIYLYPIQKIGPRTYEVGNDPVRCIYLDEEGNVRDYPF